MPIRKPGILLIALMCLLTACSAGAQPQPQVQGQAQRFPTPTAPAPRTVTATRTVAVDGVLALATPGISLGFDLAGKTVTTVHVKAGQVVKTGDVLATVDDTSLQDAVADAQLSLTLNEANMTLQNVPPTKEAIAAAEAALNSAYASYNIVKAGTTQADIDNAKRSMDSSWLGYLNAQSVRDNACGGSAGTNTNQCQSAEASYGRAFESWVGSQDNYKKLLEPVSQSSLTQAYASVVSAKSKLDALNAGETAEQKKVDEAQLKQARATLQNAQAALAQATLLSPCDCVVQQVDAAVGMLAPSPAFTLVDLAGIQFKTTNLSELDMAGVRVGAPVSIRLKAHNRTFSGKVSAVLAQSSGTQGTTALFTVLIDLDKTDALLLPGMTGQAEITAETGPA